MPGEAAALSNSSFCTLKSLLSQALKGCSSISRETLSSSLCPGFARQTLLLWWIRPKLRTETAPTLSAAIQPNVCVRPFPPGRANHWSAIIGASHSKNYVLWEYGGYASDGVKQVAELGSPVKMEEEIRQKVSFSRRWQCGRSAGEGLASAQLFVYCILRDISILVIANHCLSLLKVRCACAAAALLTKD